MAYHWWQRGVIYQIYPRSFKDSNGDGIGDLEGIIQKLDYLNNGTHDSLGIEAIWISPFYPSPMADFGYDVANYVDIDPMFGDLADFDRLITEAHQRGIKVIIDYVPNHTSEEHPWFLESRSSRDNPRRDWYIWRDAKPDGSPPNNWGSWFGGPSWTWDEHTGQYYLHSFTKEQPDLNWANPAVYQAMMDVLRFWLDRGVDGFRMDVVFLIDKHPQLLDNPPNPNPAPDLSPNDLAGRQLNIHNREQPGLFKYLRDFRKLTDEYTDRVIIGEIWVELDAWVKYFGENGDALHLPFNFRLLQLPEWNAELVRQSVDELEQALPSFGWGNYVLGSHDIGRLATRIGQDQARIAAMLLLTLRGTPTLYNGDEIGMENGVIPPDKIRDPQGIILGAHRTRDVCRTPVQWDSSAYAGFSTVEPWLPVSEDYRSRNIQVQGLDPKSMLSLYRKLLWYRHGSAALYGGSYLPVDGPAGTYLYLREHDSERKLIALNFTNETKAVTLTDHGRIVLSTYLDREEAINGEFHLRANEGVIIEL
ncbi:MAG: alpha-amylase family glycosyl hydrolase [Anaerolineae bacterium]|jgi:alpha-glucosidase|nr:alpha-amylase family glycosyl hydrolase [Anaerolineae bacterium]